MGTLVESATCGVQCRSVTNGGFHIQELTMSKFQSKLSLVSLDDRIVPSSTVTPTPSSAASASYTPATQSFTEADPTTNETLKKVQALNDEIAKLNTEIAALNKDAGELTVFAKSYDLIRKGAQATLDQMKKDGAPQADIDAQAKVVKEADDNYNRSKKLLDDANKKIADKQKVVDDKTKERDALIQSIIDSKIVSPNF